MIPKSYTIHSITIVSSVLCHRSIFQHIQKTSTSMKLTYSVVPISSTYLSGRFNRWRDGSHRQDTSLFSLCPVPRYIHEWALYELKLSKIVFWAQRLYSNDLILCLWLEIGQLNELFAIASVTTVIGQDCGPSLTITYHHYMRVNYYSNKLAQVECYPFYRGRNPWVN